MAETMTAAAPTRLDSLIANSPVASVISNPRLPDNPIIACNQAFRDLTGYDDDEIIGRNCRFLSGPETEPWLSDTIRDGVRERRPVLVEILNYKKDGTQFRNAVLVAPIFDNDGELEFFLGSQVEIPADAPGPSTGRHAQATKLVNGLTPRQRGTDGRKTDRQRRRATDRRAEALPMQRQSVAIYLKSLGPRHPLTKAAEDWLADMEKAAS